MKRHRAILILGLLIGAWIICEALLYRRAVPPRRVIDLHSFVKWRPDTQKFILIDDPSGEYLMAIRGGAGLLPSGPSAYLFDHTGRFVDWSADIGDDDSFDARWRAQVALADGHFLNASQAARWPIPTMKAADTRHQ